MVKILEFQENDLNISGEEETIKEFVNTIRAFERGSLVVLPTKINDIIYSMEIKLKDMYDMDEDDWEF